MHNRRVGPLEVQTKLDGKTNMASDVEGRQEMALDSFGEGDSNDEEGEKVYYCSVIEVLVSRRDIIIY